MVLWQAALLGARNLELGLEVALLFSCVVVVNVCMGNAEETTMCLLRGVAGVSALQDEEDKVIHLAKERKAIVSVWRSVCEFSLETQLSLLGFVELPDHQIRRARSTKALRQQLEETSGQFPQL